MRNPPGFWIILATLLLALWCLADLSHPITPSLLTCFAVLPFLVLVVDYWHRLFYADSWRGLWRWAVLPVATVLVMSALVEPWPIMLRFSLSRQAFEAKVAEVQANSAEQGPQWVGPYWIEWIRADHGKGVGFVTGHSIIDPVGFAYDPSWPPSHPTHPFHRHIVGNWYATEW